MEGYLWMEIQRLESCGEKKEGQSKVSSSQGTHFGTQLEALVRCQMTKRDIYLTSFVDMQLVLSKKRCGTFHFGERSQEISQNLILLGHCS